MRQTETDRARHTGRHTTRHTDKQTDKQKYRQPDRQTHTDTYRDRIGMFACVSSVNGAGESSMACNANAKPKPTHMLNIGPE